MPPTRSTQRWQTFSPVLHRWSARLSLKPHLASITLANVLAGDTCEPISLSDFEGYLAYKEHSLENLQFVVWFLDYRKRFDAWSEGEQASNVRKNEFRLYAPSRASIERRAAESLATPATPDTRSPVGIEYGAPDSAVPESYDHVILPSPPTSTSALSPHTHIEEVPNRTPSPDLTNVDFTHVPGVETDPFKKECMRVITTFLRPGVKELNLQQVVRETAIRTLEHNRHPDGFFPIYQEIYHVLETVSLRRFLIHNSANINWPKQLFWYRVGLTDLLIGLAIILSMVLRIPTPPEGNRAWRLFGVPFLSFGAMQTYSAWRGFCTQVWGRRAVQLRVWELQNVDEEYKRFWSQILVDDESSRAKISARPIVQIRNGFNRPAIFGPEKVVLDQRILAVHQKTVKEILVLGACVAFGAAVIVLCVPSLCIR